MGASTRENGQSVWVVNVADGPQVVALANDPAGGTRQLVPRDVIASAPSGKAFTGQIVLYPDAAGAGSCIFHGHLALQG